MDRDFRALFLSVALCGAAVVVQSTLLHWVALGGVKPDLALIVLIFVSVRRGSAVGQLTGFISGIVEDLLSLAPVGFNALSRTIIAFLYGRLSGNIFVDPILMPLLLTVAATLLKGFVSSLTVVVFAVPAPGFGVFAGPLWIEVGYNAFLAPFLFALLGLLAPLKQKEKERA